MPTDVKFSALDPAVPLSTDIAPFISDPAGVPVPKRSTIANFFAAGQPAEQAAALVGTSGAPGAANKFVTDADARNTNARTPTAHTHPESDVVGLTADLTAINAAIAAITSKVAAYATTLANVSNTAVETDVLHFTVPGNAWGDGELVKCEFAALCKNNKGGTGFVAFKVNVGAGAQVTLQLSGGGAGTRSNFNNDATEYKTVFRFFCRRVGSAVWIYNREYNFITDTVGNITPINTPYLQLMQIDGISTPTNFTGDNVVTLKVTLDAADATYYLKPQVAQALHFKS